MNELRVYNDNASLSFEDGRKEEVIKKINEILSNLAFFRDLVKNNHVIRTNVWTHLGLNEAYHRELAKMTGYDSILAKERDERYAKIREKNEEIRKLTEQRGKEITPEAVEGALRRYEDIFCAWYRNEGFHYASISNMSAYGMSAELTSEMNYKEFKPEYNKEIYNKIWDENKSTENKILSGWDIYEDQFHAELLDTDNNKKRLTELLVSDFHNVRIFKFSGRRNDYGSFSLRTEIFISYSDLNIYIDSL